MSVISEPVERSGPMTTRMHPLFVELFIDPPDDLGDDGETRRARARRAHRSARRQTVRASSHAPRPSADAAR